MIISCKLGICVIVVAIILAVFTQRCLPNQYDPHVYPEKGPFIEGWYMRLIDADNARSLGVLFGRVLPRGDDGNSPGESSSDAPDTYLGLIRSNGSDASMVVVEAYPNEDDIEVTVKGGKPVTKNPYLMPSSYFEWTARSYGFFNVTPNSTVFDFTIDEINFSGNFSGPVAWDSSGRGPEGWLTHLPSLPIHWFVYSLASPGTYTWRNLDTGRTLSGNAHAHQEKNWGSGFPEGWVWTQGFNKSTNTAFAGTFGVLSPYGLPAIVPAHLFGYRNFARNLSLDFRPDNSVTTRDLHPCEGRAAIRIYSPTHRVELTMIAPVATFDRCLRGPVETGFEYNLVETYVATIAISIEELGLWGYYVIETGTFHSAAFEFGKTYMCPQNPCT
ncbi:uncharacterized protein [Diadema setosum]|uniref:uncharacterized protein n=1 Tax=Diadema setosum TaxID=31175 RepID=UPI003B3AA44C